MRKYGWLNILVIGAAVITAGMFLVVTGILIGRRSGLPKAKIAPAETNTGAEGITPTPNYSRGIWMFNEETRLSPNGNYLAYWENHIKEGKKTTRLQVVEQTGEYSVERDGIAGIWTMDTPEKFITFELVWSSDNRKLAAMAGDSLVVVGFSPVSPEYSYQKEVIRPAIEYEGRFREELTGEQKLWFESGVLMASVKAGVEEVWPENKMRLEAENILGIYPFKGGYLFWIDEARCCQVKLMRANADGVITDTGLEVVDYVGPVIANEAGTRICYETGTSGYHGYGLYDLRAEKTVKSGQQYSWCGKWLNNDQVLIKEKSYWNQWVTQYYIYDWNKKIRVPVVMVETGDGEY